MYILVKIHQIQIKDSHKYNNQPKEDLNRWFWNRLNKLSNLQSLGNYLIKHFITEKNKYQTNNNNKMNPLF